MKRNVLVGSLLTLLTVGGRIGLRRAALLAALAAATSIGGWLFAVDSSYDQLTAEEAVRLKEAGVGLYIQALTALPGSGLEQPANRVVSLRNAHTVGLDIAGYALLGPSWRTPAQQMDLARAGVPDDLWAALTFVAVDVEVRGVSLGMVREACTRLAELGKAPCVIYTNYNTWHYLMGDPLHDPGWLLWNAYWDNADDVDYPNLPFGGWQAEDILCEQWSGGFYIGGQYVDRSACRFIAIDEPPPSPCARPFYTREQALWALDAFTYAVGLQAFDANASPGNLDPFDQRVLRHLFACELAP